MRQDQSFPAQVEWLLCDKSERFQRILSKNETKCSNLSKTSPQGPKKWPHGLYARPAPNENFGFANLNHRSERRYQNLRIHNELAQYDIPTTVRKRLSPFQDVMWGHMPNVWKKLIQNSTFWGKANQKISATGYTGLFKNGASNIGFVR